MGDEFTARSSASSPALRAQGAFEAMLMRIEAAEGPDRRLDLDVVSLLREGAVIEESRLSFFRDGFEPMDCVWPRVTASIDAAISLVDEKLPDREWAAGDDRENGRCWALIDDDCWDEAMGRFEGFAKTAPLAILSALFHALIEQRVSNHPLHSPTPEAPESKEGE
jgi:hypothetical protein